jgi:DNA-binding IclR family transcriptional regulator
MPRQTTRAARTADRARYSAPALEKGMDIIELLAESESGLTISEISRRLKRRMSELKLAHRGTPARTLATAAVPVMHELSARINQSCHLVVRSGARGVVILRQENPKRHANLTVRIGAVIHLVSSCSGRVLLAFMEPAERDKLLGAVPEPLGIGRHALERALARIRKHGHEHSRSPVTVGVTDISYPVRGFDGRVLAALTIPYLHVLDNSLPTTVEQTRQLLERAAWQISISMGWEH